MSTSPAVISAFKAWFASVGGFVHPSLEFVYHPEAGVHLCVARTHAGPIARGTLAISCPHDVSLSALNAGRINGESWPRSTEGKDGGSEPLELPEALRREARPQFVAAVWVAVQYALGERSRWRAYLDVLPGVPVDDGDVEVEQGGGGDGRAERRGLGELDTPLWWGEEERKWLQGTNLAKGIVDLGAGWEGEWRRWEEVVLDWGRRKGVDVTWKLIKYALTILGSRAFSSSQVASLVSRETGQPRLSLYNPDMLLYPGVDSLNHNPLTQNRWRSDEKSFGIVVEDELTAGMEVWNPYGGKGNGELLLSYGFCLEDNPCDSFAIRLPPSTPPMLRVLAQTSPLSGPATPSPQPSLATNTSATADTSPMTPHNHPPAQNLAQNTFYVRPSSRHHTVEEGYSSFLVPALSLAEEDVFFEW